MLRSPLNAGPTPWLAVAVALAFLVLAMALGVLLARCDDGRGYVPGRRRDPPTSPGNQGCEGSPTSRELETDDVETRGKGPRQSPDVTRTAI